MRSLSAMHMCQLTERGCWNAAQHPFLPAPALRQNLLSKATPDFAAAYAIYTNGSNAYRPDGVTRRTM